jgi:hypothetical protein
MRATSICHIALLAAASFVAGSADAEYRCTSAALPADKGACRAAEQGPRALGQYVQRMRSLRELYFYDYVNNDTLRAWDVKEMRERAAKEPEKVTQSEPARDSPR